MVKLPGYASMMPVNPYGTTGAIIAVTRDAIARAIATGARISAPLAVTPCGSIVPSGNKTVSIFAGTHSRNSIQLMRSISRVLGVPRRRDSAAAAFIDMTKTPAERDDDASSKRRSLFVLRFYLAIKRSHADAEHARRLLARTTAMCQGRFDYTALLLLNKFVETLANWHCRHC